METAFAVAFQHMGEVVNYWDVFLNFLLFSFRANATLSVSTYCILTQAVWVKKALSGGLTDIISIIGEIYKKIQLLVGRNSFFHLEYFPVSPHK